MFSACSFPGQPGRPGSDGPTARSLDASTPRRHDSPAGSRIARRSSQGRKARAAVLTHARSHKRLVPGDPDCFPHRRADTRRRPAGLVGVLWCVASSCRRFVVRAAGCRVGSNPVNKYIGSCRAAAFSAPCQTSVPNPGSQRCRDEQPSRREPSRSGRRSLGNLTFPRRTRATHFPACPATDHNPSWSGAGRPRSQDPGHRSIHRSP